MRVFVRPQKTLQVSVFSAIAITMSSAAAGKKRRRSDPLSTSFRRRRAGNDKTIDATRQGGVVARRAGEPFSFILEDGGIFPCCLEHTLLLAECLHLCVTSSRGGSKKNTQFQ